MRLEATDFPDELIDRIADAVAARVLGRFAPQAAPDEILDTRQAAIYLNFSKQQLEGWRCRGGGPVFIKLDRRVRYRRSELDAWLDERRRGNTSEEAR